jgi:hypothetical protein
MMDNPHDSMLSEQYKDLDQQAKQMVYNAAYK